MQEIRKTQSHKIILWLAAALLLALTGGCAGTVNSPSPAKMVSIGKAQEELVEAPELPGDDGIPLTAEERIALHSTGYLDVYLTPEEKREVEMHFKFYLHRQRARFERYLERGEAYLPYVQRVFREQGIPEEIAYLAIVESGFNPNAVSRAGATGMWQFMQYTGKGYGLEQNAWVDERRDPFKATVAAATYLNKLYSMFGDWHLAIAAYNAGEGKIMRAMESTGAEDFFELCKKNEDIRETARRLKPETQQYVPRLLAVTKIMRNLELLGFKAPDPSRGHQFVEVQAGPGTDLGKLATQAEIDMELFMSLNPAFKRNITPPFSSGSVVYVPVDSAPKATSWLASRESKQFAGWENYKVRSGDTLASVSRRTGVPMEALRQANKLQGNALRSGQTIKIPATQVADITPAAPAARSNVSSSSGTARASGGKNQSYVVLQGDTLYRIARRYGVSVSSLQAANGMNTKDTSLKPGSKIIIPGNASPASTQSGTASPAGKNVAVAKDRNAYTVRKDDTLYSLAQDNNTTVDELMRVNGLSGSKLRAGQKLLLP